ncbi:4-alpha-glucanotransferase [Candidatus Methylacidiphilum fumarolicum]|uniref:4-alpha-glucanotransferase n=2 Tax=Candidatus Methylacidiphilum fumarolicum TaxID=591154 RepID=I0JWT0_METFB|nr:4-alpha-glucanotransferase [Candidatus Methylacidiphilum fumarolicum]MBW6414395.1 4-alpha-glucanotransferase [Candidatus Methylacidiphilum fumarolicum]TFE69400.1 4-alpha-glucanotransferase [Candidatus Methylacidiphilum fumarolicum]TFE72895.1 4-alpha-glucanotransferase [Candidatus Methylacidiphilum fumarolicum]TFE74638.1 4-alpha-glucanotransferase [Candidatus Methylacidiphilum fumarolicum]TFE77204.1 4-alpha-glucanotransferase [Candidatus Methylacidiphilum fumarolicum]
MQPINIDEKRVGLLAPVFSLRRENDLGIGDTKAVLSTIDFCKRMHINYLQILPINETSEDNSPYNALSSIAYDPMLVTMEPDFIPGLSSEDLKFSNLEKERLEGQFIDYKTVKSIKKKLFEKAFYRFIASSHLVKKKEFIHFCKSNQDWLSTYTLFRFLVDENAGDTHWNDWPEEIKTYENAIEWLKRQKDQKWILEKRRFYSFIQWVAHTQWKQVREYADSKNIKLMGDIPYGINRYSSDVWASQELFDCQWSCGAPPETFFQGDEFVKKWGQNWGFPLYRWENHEAESFRWWKRRILQTTKIFHAFRLDHVLGFFRIYAFPWFPEQNNEFLPLSIEEVKLKTGGKLPRFFPGPDEPDASALVNENQGKKILSVILETAKNEIVIAEDLGLVPRYVRPLLQKMGIPGFTIPMFERLSDYSFKPITHYPALSVATYATHDHPPLMLQYNRLCHRAVQDPNSQERRELQRIADFLGWNISELPNHYDSRIHLRFIETLLYSPCWLVVFTISDLLGIELQFNHPGSKPEDNWKDRLEKPIMDYLEEPEFGSKLKKIKQLIDQTKRS